MGLKKIVVLAVFVSILLIQFNFLNHNFISKAIELQEIWCTIANEMNYVLEWNEGSSESNRLGPRWDAVIYDEDKYYSGMDCIVLESRDEADNLFSIWIDRFIEYRYVKDYKKVSLPQYRYFKWESGDWYYIVFQSGNLVIDFQSSLETKKEADYLINRLIREIERPVFLTVIRELELE